jgi:hypothetical protein
MKMGRGTSPFLHTGFFGGIVEVMWGSHVAPRNMVDCRHPESVLRGASSMRKLLRL